MGEQVGAGPKKKTSGKLVHIETDNGKDVLPETEPYKAKDREAGLNASSREVTL